MCVCVAMMSICVCQCVCPVTTAHLFLLLYVSFSRRTFWNTFIVTTTHRLRLGHFAVRAPLFSGHGVCIVSITYLCPHIVTPPLFTPEAHLGQNNMRDPTFCWLDGIYRSQSSTPATPHAFTTLQTGSVSRNRQPFLLLFFLLGVTCHPNGLCLYYPHLLVSPIAPLYVPMPSLVSYYLSLLLLPNITCMPQYYPQPLLLLLLKCGGVGGWVVDRQVGGDMGPCI